MSIENLKCNSCGSGNYIVSSDNIKYQYFEDGVCTYTNLESVGEERVWCKDCGDDMEIKE